MCRAKEWLRTNLPVPVFLNRLAAPLCVFNLGMVNLSGALMFLDDSWQPIQLPYSRGWVQGVRVRTFNSIAWPYSGRGGTASANTCSAIARRNSSNPSPVTLEIAKNG